MVSKNGSFTSDELLLRQLKELLLSEDRMLLQKLEGILDDQSLLSEKISPIMEQRLETFKQTFPKEYKKVVDRLMQEHLKNSHDEIMDMMYPVLGTMVRKYIDHQFQLLKDGIEERLLTIRKKVNFWKRIKMHFNGVTPSEFLLADSQKPVVKEVYLIERDSGLLLAYAAKSENLDKESVAGMLTAIKSFVEDAFRKGEENLDFISYDHHKILIQNYRKYYVAALVTGSISTSERAILSDALYDFIMKEYTVIQHNHFEYRYEQISGLLEERFIKESLLDKPEIHHINIK